MFRKKRKEEKKKGKENIKERMILVKLVAVGLVWVWAKAEQNHTPPLTVLPVSHTM